MKPLFLSVMASAHTTTETVKIESFHLDPSNQNPKNTQNYTPQKLKEPTFRR